MTRSVKEILAKRKNEEINLKIRGLEDEISTLQAGKIETKSITEEEAKELTVEELEALDKDAEETETANAEIEATTEKLTAEIEELRSQIIEIKEQEIKKEERGAKGMKKELGIELRHKYKNLNLRRKYENENEALDFYDQVRASSVTGAEVKVPLTIVELLFEELAKVSTFYNKVTVRRTSDNVRGVYVEGTGLGIWIERCNSITEELKLNFTQIDFGDFKLGGFSIVCNADLEDIASIESLVLINQARAMAQALDKAVIDGKGPAMKEPTGIANNTLTGIPFAYINEDFVLNTILEVASVKGPKKEIYMTETTYNTFYLPELLLKEQGLSAWLVGVPQKNLNNVNIVWLDEDTFPDVGKVYVGSFDKYMLVERSSIKMTKSTDVNFLDDQTVYKAVGRFDGKPIDKKFFKVINLTPVV